MAKIGQNDLVELEGGDIATIALMAAFDPNPEGDSPYLLAQRSVTQYCAVVVAVANHNRHVKYQQKPAERR